MWCKPPGGYATPIATSITMFYRPLRNTKVQLVGSCMQSMGVVAAVEPWLLGTFGELPTNASSPGDVINVHGSVDSRCSSSAFATRAFTWSSRLVSRSLPCFLYMCLSSSNPCFQVILFPSPLVRPVCSLFPKPRLSSSLSLEGLNEPFSLSLAYFNILDTASWVSSLLNLRLPPDDF